MEIYQKVYLSEDGLTLDEVSDVGLVSLIRQTTQQKEER
jgi:hypothetical protein